MATIDEKELEDFLMIPGNLQHLELYLGMSSYVKRQFNLGGYGIADIVVIDPQPYEINQRHYSITVIELKKDEVNCGTLQQACRYIAGLKELMKLGGLSGLYIDFRVVLVGGSLNLNDWVYLGHQLNDVSVWTYTLNLETGVEFHPEDLSTYRLKVPGFPKGAESIFPELLEPRRLAEEAHYTEHMEEFKARIALPAPAPTDEVAIG